MHQTLLAIDDWLFFKFDFGWSFLLLLAELLLLFWFFRETFWEKVIIVFGVINHLYLSIWTTLMEVADPYRDYQRKVIELAEGQEGMTLSYVFSEFFSTLSYSSVSVLFFFGGCAPILAGLYFLRKHYLLRQYKPHARRYGIAIVFSSLTLFLVSWALTDRPDAEWCGSYTDSLEEKQLCLQKLQ